MRPAAVLPLAFLAVFATAQQDPPASRPADAPFWDGLEWRLVGPARGGRVAAVTGVRGQPEVFYFGATGGGVWKTTDAGRSWRCVSDGFFGGSIGAVAVADSDPNVIYVGGGEKTVRGNVSHGDGMWRSTDAGKTWKQAGLPDSRHIPRIRVHPRDPDVVYAACLGHLFGPNAMRGVFKSENGGETWERILFANENAGAIELAMDPGNPRVLYAATWRVRRTPSALESGGEGSALWKTTDGGRTWTDLSKNDGFPKGTLGIIGVAISPANAERVYAIVEAEAGGVLRSDDGGKTWRKQNSDRNLRQRAWYYTRIYADPKDQDVCWVVNVGLHRSQDGGRTFESIRAPHGDHHDLWIAPEDTARLINGNDGGACVSGDGGRTWSTQDNQPTAQFYRVTTDDHVPYRIYGAQQDNSTVRILSTARESERGGGRGGDRDWERTAGGESGWLAPDPGDHEIVYGGSYGGYLERRDHRTGLSRTVTPWPDNPMGHGAGDARYRFQWNYPIFFSPHAGAGGRAPLYCAANVLFRTVNEGQTWEPVSPDLTRNDASKLGPSGGPITKDNTGVEYYCTIFAAAESWREPGVLWCGSDDGLVHLSRDAGKSWLDVTPADLPEWSQVNSLEVHPFADGGLYLAATRYKLDDFTPSLWRTTDYGKSWTRIDAGIPRETFTRVIRADRSRRGLLFAGTERGVHVSFDDGASWRSLQGNLPIVPVTDLALKDDDLIAATQGRSFWILEDYSPLREDDAAVRAGAAYLFPPQLATRGLGRAELRFRVNQKLEQPTGTLELRDQRGQLVRRAVAGAAGGAAGSDGGDEGEDLKLALKEGMNRFSWDLRWAPAKTFPGVILWGGGTQGPLVAPGRYVAKLTIGAWSAERAFEVQPDPRSGCTLEDYRAQEQFLLEARDKLSDAHQAIRRIRKLGQDLDAVLGRIEEPKDAAIGQPLRTAAKDLKARLTAVEEALYQTKNQAQQDPLNYPIRLNNRLAALSSAVAGGDQRPSDGARTVRAELFTAIDAELEKLRAIESQDVVAINRLLREADVPYVSAEPPAGKSAAESRPSRQ